MLKKIKEANLKLKLLKYQQFQIKLKFVEYLVERNDIRSDLQNVEKIKNVEILQNLEGF